MRIVQNIYPQNPAEFETLEEAYLHWKLDNRSAAAQLVLGGAVARIDNIADLVFDKDGLRRAVENWLAIQSMEETWGLEPDIFYQHEQYAEKWQKVQRLSAKMITRAITCKAQGGTLGLPEATHILKVELWKCDS